MPQCNSEIYFLPTEILKNNNFCFNDTHMCFLQTADFIAALQKEQHKLYCVILKCPIKTSTE